MPPAGLRYTLVGFSADLDWRPLHFLKTIPQNRICRVCGLVCMRTALLPCMHVLCEFCYEQCVQGNELLCPLDDQHCQDGEVDWKECPVDDILRREVACWNEGAGCGAVMAASEICRHFRSDCGYHLASCFKCSARILRRDLCLHLRSECRDLILPLTSESQEQISSKDKTFLSLFARSLEEQTCEMRSLFERLSIGSRPQDERFTEICHSLNTLRETLSRELHHNTNTVRQSLEALAETVRQNHESSATDMLQVVASNEHIKECLVAGTREMENLSNTVKRASNLQKSDVVNVREQKVEELVRGEPNHRTSTGDGQESSQQTLECARNGLRHAELHLDSCVFFVSDVQAHKEGALKDGHKYFFIRVVYLRGYCVQPGLKFIKYGNSVSFHICFFIHQGYMDESLAWPFRHNVKLSFINAVTDTVRTVIFKVTSAELQGPTGSDKRLIKVEDVSLSLDNFLRDGYVHDDKLLVKWELLP